MIEQLTNPIPAGQFPVASTVSDLAAATAIIMSHYHSSEYGNASQFNWSTWLASGVESPTYVTAYNCAQRFPRSYLLFAMPDSVKRQPQLFPVSRGDVLYALVPDAIFTPNLAAGSGSQCGEFRRGCGFSGRTGYDLSVRNRTGNGCRPAIRPERQRCDNLAGVSVLFDGTPAPVIYASALQTSVVVPYEVVNQTTTEMQIEYNGAQWKRYPLRSAQHRRACLTRF